MGNLLEAAFPLNYNNGGVSYGWHWLPGASTDIRGLTLAEALSLCLLENYLQPLLPASILSVLAPRFSSASKTLNALSEENTVARWTDKMRAVSPSLPFLPPTIAAGMLETVQEAVLLERQIEVRYPSFSAPQASKQRLHPLAIV